MRQFLIYLLGGLTNEDHEGVVDQYRNEIDELHKHYNDARHLLISEHDAAMRHASVQLQQLQEMLRQKELECEGIERGRVAMNEALESEKAKLSTMSIELRNLREACTNIEDERDTLRAKLSRPKKPKPTKVEA